MRRAAKIDANQSQIVDGLRALGVSVFSTAPIGAGIPDLVAGYYGRNYLLEIKPPRKELRATQVRFREMWGGQCATVRSLDEALEAIGYRAPMT